jgi:hypothetical protein
VTREAMSSQERLRAARDRVLVGGIDATASTSLSPDAMHRYVHDLLDEIRSEAGAAAERRPGEVQ